MLDRADRDSWIEAMARHGSHSNHPVMLLGPHVFERAAGMLFASRRALGFQVLACDPLGPPEAREAALAAFDEAHADHRMVLVGLSEAVARSLAARGYGVVKIGEEPWVTLREHAPKGNRGKGVRAARNQALRAGCAAVEWDRARLMAHRDEIEAVFQAWRGLTILSMEGGVLGTDPFAEVPGRRYFLGLRGGRIEAVLVATPIRPGATYYLEDLVYRRDAARGVQELLTLAALDALADSGAQEVSLGLVFLRKLDRGTLPGSSRLQRMVACGQRLVGYFYNATGLDLFRKRFPVARWEGAYLAFRGPRHPSRPLSPRLAMACNLLWGLMAVLDTLEPTFNWPW